jgi:hypothetical protein
MLEAQGTDPAVWCDKVGVRCTEVPGPGQGKLSWREGVGGGRLLNKAVKEE